MTLPAHLLRFPPVLAPSTLALLILALAFLAATVAALLLALAFEHRSKLDAMHREQRRNARRVEERLSTDRACVLRDITLDRKKSTDDENSS